MKDYKTVLCILISLSVLLISLIVLIILSRKDIKVTFMSDNKIIETVYIRSGKSVSKPNDPTKEGYVFNNWYLNNEIYNFNDKVRKNITLIARWDIDSNIKTATITFDTNGGSEINPQTIEKNSKLNNPPTPIKEGYSFLEWQLNGEKFDFDTEIKENITLKATWIKDVYYTVKFNSNGGSEIESQNVRLNYNVVIPVNPIKEGYTFLEWQLNGEKFDFNTPIKENITLKAKWIKDVYYTVRFNSNGGSKIENQTVKQNSTAYMPVNPIKEGYTFLEWRYNDVKYNFSSKVTDNITLTAEWVKDLKIELSSTDLNLKQNETIKISANITPYVDKNVIWSSDDSSIASIDNNGNIKAINIGSTIIRAKIDNIEATCKIIVEE